MQEKYPENIIVTVRMVNPQLEADVRIPADSVFEKWLPEIALVLNEYRGTDLDSATLAVSFNGRKLRLDDTLASLGAWEGSVLWLEGGEKYAYTGT